MMQDQTAIALSQLTKSYGQNRGIFEVDFSVAQGETFGFLGPNGAGKTVTMRHLMGFVKPDSGSASILGRDCFSDRAAIQSHLGYLPGEIASSEELSGIAFLTFIARLKNLKDLSRMEELIEYFQLDPKNKIKKMSKGTKQKVGIICAFMSSPEILLLDEPTSGLDPLMQNRFIDLVLEEKKRGTTIFLSSHIFEEIERTCDRVAFIRSGRIAAVDSMSAIQETRNRSFSITFANNIEFNRYLSRHTQALKTSLNTVEITVSGSMDSFLKDLTTYRVKNLISKTQTLEELFLHLYGSSTEGETDE